MRVDEAAHPLIGTLDAGGEQYDVTCRVTFDGVEYIGRLWFTPALRTDRGIPDRAAIPGRTRDEVLSLARRLSPYDLALRHRRAVAEKRRYLALRRVTDDIIAKIKYMNQVAISTRGGLIDSEGAAQEMALVEQQIIEAVKRLKDVAGVEG
jgi:hypothetical protein